MDDRATALAGRLDELASALERVNAPGDAAARLIELASVATLKAVALEHAFELPPAAPPRAVEAPTPLRRRAA